jgi:hypothetical protein
MRSDSFPDGKGVFSPCILNFKEKAVHTQNRDKLVSSPLLGVTSEQIDAYRKLYAEDHKAQEKARAEKGKKTKGAKKKSGAKKAPPLLTEDESVLALARAVGDRRVKKTGVIETKRRY